MTGKRIDSNHAEIKRALQAAGMKTIDTHSYGQGFPDLIAIHPDGRLILIEIKSHLTMTRPEVQFVIQLVNPVYRIASSVEQALEIVRDER